MPDKSWDFASAAIIRDSKRTFDKPRDWTTDKAWLFTKAKASDGIGMSATFKAKPEQAKVLTFQIDGGIRKKGDVGANPYDIAVGAAPELTGTDGGIARNTLKRLGKDAKKERTQRKALAPRRAAIRALRNAAADDKARVRVSKRLQPLKWVVKSKSAPGTFVGSVEGVRGYWQRPERSLAAGPRRKGVKSVRLQGKPKLLLAFADKAVYGKKLKYSDTMTRAQTAKMTTAQFAIELARIQAARSTP